MMKQNVVNKKLGWFYWAFGGLTEILGLFVILEKMTKVEES